MVDARHEYRQAAEALKRCGCEARATWQPPQQRTAGTADQMSSSSNRVEQQSEMRKMVDSRSCVCQAAEAV